MSETSFPKSVVRVVMIRFDASGEALTKELYRRKRKSRRSLKEVERVVNRVVSANEVFGRELAKGYRRNRTKKGYRWVSNAAPNLAKAADKAVSKFTK